MLRFGIIKFTLICMQREVRSMAYRPATKSGGKAFFVPAEAAENLKSCTAAQLRILLLVLSGKASDPEAAAAALGISCDDAKDYFDYWVERGVFENDLASAPAASIKKISSAKEQPPQERLSVQEVRRLQQEDDGVAFVLREAERILGGTFNSYDTGVLAWLVSSAGVPPEVLVTVIGYCNSIGHGKLRYIQKVALEWLDAGISTVEMAEERIRILTETAGWEGQMKSVLEIHDRSLVPKEREYCENWRKLGLSPELVRAAYERSVESTGKRSFAYINKVLISWKQSGVTTPAQAAAEKSKAKGEGKPSFDLDDVERKMLLEVPAF